MKLLRSLVTPYSRSLALQIILAGVCLALFGLALPLFAGIIFDKVIVHKSYSTLHVIAIGLMVMLAFDALINFLSARHVHYLSAYIDRSLSTTVTGHLLKLPLRFFDSQKRSEIAGRVRKLGELRRVLTAVSVFALIDLAFTMVILALIAMYSAAVALVVGLTVPVLFVLSLATRPSVQARYKAQSDEQSEYEALVSEAVNNVATIKMGGLEGWWQYRWQQAHGKFLSASQEAKRVAAVEDTLVKVVQSVASLLVLWVGAYLALDGRLSPGQLITCWMFARRVMGPSARILRVWQSLQRAWQSESRVSELVDTPAEQDQAASRLPFPDTPVIRVADVVFRYAADSPKVLNGLGCEIAAGSFVGIVGKSGSGKSTLARLLQRHLEPTSGKIFVGNTDLQLLDLASLRSRFQIVTHDAALFRGTILENLQAGAAGIGLQEASRACEICGARQFVEAFPKAYDTVLDERSSQLSSGQRQRLAVARAILKAPQALLLDEATNALDAETEHKLLLSIREALPRTTLVVITHRHAMLDKADRIFVLEAGKMSEGASSARHGLAVLEAIPR